MSVCLYSGVSEGVTPGDALTYRAKVSPLPGKIRWCPKKNRLAAPC